MGSSSTRTIFAMCSSRRSLPFRLRSLLFLPFWEPSPFRKRGLAEALFSHRQRLSLDHFLPLRPDLLLQLRAGFGHRREVLHPFKRTAGIDDRAGVKALFAGLAPGI